MKSFLAPLLAVFLFQVSAWAQEESINLEEELSVPEKPESASGLEEPELPDVPLVEREFIPIRRTEHIEDAIPAYKDRRGTWGFLLGFGYSMYTPIDYAPSFTAGSTFDDVYGSTFAGMFELTLSGKLNLPFGSLVAGLGGGFFKVDSGGSTVQTTVSSLLVIPVRLEGSLELDTLFSEPLIVPYVSGGLYIVSYQEEQSGITVNGNTQMAPYFAVGANFQLNWAEREVALNSYLDYGIENTYIYVEGRQFLSSSNAADPDFGTAMQFAGGARLEY